MFVNKINNFKMKKKQIIIFLILALVSYFGYNYIYHKQRDIATEKSNYSIKLLDLENDLKNGDESFNKKYLDKTIEITGMISEIDSMSNAILIDDKIFATFSEKLNVDLKVNQNIQIKARCIGYDDLLEKFRFDQVTIIK